MTTCIYVLSPKPIPIADARHYYPLIINASQAIRVPTSLHIIQILKAIGPEVNLSDQPSPLKHPTGRQNFANTLQPHCAHYLTLRLKKIQGSSYRFFWFEK